MVKTFAKSVDAGLYVYTTITLINYLLGLLFVGILYIFTLGEEVTKRYHCENLCEADDTLPL